MKVIKDNLCEMCGEIISSQLEIYGAYYDTKRIANANDFELLKTAGPCKTDEELKSYFMDYYQAKIEQELKQELRKPKRRYTKKKCLVYMK